MSVSTRSWAGGCGSDTRCAQCGRYIGGSDTTWTSSFGGGDYCSRKCAEEYDSAQQKQQDEAIASDKKFYNGFLKGETTLKTRFFGGFLSLLFLGLIVYLLSDFGKLPEALRLSFSDGVSFFEIVKMIVLFFVGFGIPKPFIWFGKIFSIFTRIAK